MHILWSCVHKFAKYEVSVIEPVAKRTVHRCWMMPDANDDNDTWRTIYVCRIALWHLCEMSQWTNAICVIKFAKFCKYFPPRVDFVPRVITQILTNYKFLGHWSTNLINWRNIIYCIRFTNYLCKHWSAIIFSHLFGIILVNLTWWASIFSKFTRYKH